MSENAMVWGESNAKGFDGEQTLLNEGESKEFYSK